MTTSKCDICGKFISIQDLVDGVAVRYLVTPDSYFTKEEYVTYCKDCPKNEKN